MFYSSPSAYFLLWFVKTENKNGRTSWWHDSFILLVHLIPLLEMICVSFIFNHIFVPGVATAFAAKDILGNMLSGLSLQFLKPFAVGDSIKVQSSSSKECVPFYPSLIIHVPGKADKS